MEQRHAKCVLENNCFLDFWIFALKGFCHVCFPRYFENILLTAASRTLWKQPPMRALNCGNAKSCEKSPEIHFSEAHLDLFLNEF